MLKRKKNDSEVYCSPYEDKYTSTPITPGGEASLRAAKTEIGKSNSTKRMLKIVTRKLV